jgi:hypothetical protein
MFRMVNQKFTNTWEMVVLLELDYPPMVGMRYGTAGQSDYRVMWVDPFHQHFGVRFGARGAEFYGSTTG